MLNVLIIDDSPIIREGLKTIITWEQMGFTICGEAEDGKEGIEKAKILHPDVIITDIKMPNIDGLEMIKQLMEQGYKGKILILTAFSEFEYARKAIEYGVDSYILKPVREEDFINKVNRIKDIILKEKEKEQNYKQSIEMSKEKIVEQMLTFSDDSSKISYLVSNYGHLFPWEKYRICVIKFTNIVDDNNIIHKIIEIIRNHLHENEDGLCFVINGQICIALQSISITKDRRKAEFLRGQIEKRTGIDVIISMGTIVDNLRELKKSYKHACGILESNFIFGQKGVVTDEMMESLQKNKFSYDQNNSIGTKQFVEKLFVAIDINSMELINNILEDLRTQIILSGLSEEKIKIFYLKLYVELINRLSVSNVCFRDEEIISENLIENIQTQNSFQNLHGFFKYKISLISNKIAQKNYDCNIKKILDYIQRYYYTDIKINVLAEIFGYNSAYLGKMFKKYTGQSFNSYIEDLRLENAKKLLQEGLKVYQAAEKVGYSEISYFRRRFRSKFGISPNKVKKHQNKFKQ